MGDTSASGLTASGRTYLARSTEIEGVPVMYPDTVRFSERRRRFISSIIRDAQAVSGLPVWRVFINPVYGHDGGHISGAMHNMVLKFDLKEVRK